MADTHHNQASTKAVEDAQKTWGSFVQFAKISGVGIAVLLILMGVFLV